MLYDAWRLVARQRSGERALVDVAAGRTWSFRDLLAWSDGADAPVDPMVFPAGHQAGFVLEVLRGWRHGRVVCPLESGQSRPPFILLPAEGAHLKATSATTGTARWIVFTAGQLASDPANLVATMGLRTDCPNLGVISLAHSYGFSSLVLPLLLHGIPLILAPSSLPEDLRRSTRFESAITLPAVPALWRSWWQAGAIPEGTRLAISAGTSLPAAVEQALFAERGIKIHNFYGASECGGIAYDATEVPRTDSSLTGTAVRNVGLTVGEDGCLCIRGPNVAQGYWPETDSSLGEGVFRSSDLAELDDGSLRLRGRADDLISVAGRKVTPDAIERVVLSHPGVRQCLVFGVPHREAGRGDAIVAVVEAHEGLSRAGLEQFVARVVPDWQMPRDWWFVDILPANARGKFQRRTWRDAYLKGRG